MPNQPSANASRSFLRECWDSGAFTICLCVLLAVGMVVIAVVNGLR